MARKSISKKVVVSVVVTSMIVIMASAIGLLSVWCQRDPAVYVDRATMACRAGEMIEAIRAYSQAYRQTLDPRWIVESGLVARSFGDSARALSLFDKAVAAGPSLLAAHRGRLELRLELIRLEPSAEAYANLRKDAEALLDIADRDPRGLLAKSIALAGLAQEDPTYAEQSLEAIQQAHTLDPKDIEIADTLAKHYELTEPEKPESTDKIKRTPGRAEQLYKTLVDAVPKQGEAWLKYGEFLLRRLKTRQEQAAARGITLTASDTKRSLQEIERLLDTATELDPKNGEIALAWGEYWSLSKQPDKAIEKLSEALKSVPDDLRIHVELARRLLEADQTERARKVLQQGLKQPFDPESYLGMLNRPLRHRLWCMLGQSYLQGLDPDSKDAAARVAEADEARRQADQELTPDHWMGRMLLGQIRRAQGRRLAAAARYQEADRMLDWSQSASDKVAVKLKLAEVQTELAQYGAANESLSAVLQHRSNDPVALAMKASLDLKIGESGKALADTRLALRGLRGQTETTGTRSSTGGHTAQADLVRQCLRIWWTASTIEQQSADAATAQQAFSPLTADDHLFLADACSLYGTLFKDSEKLTQTAMAAYLAGIQADPTRVDAIHRLVTHYSTQNRLGEARQVVQKASQALQHPPAGGSPETFETARARLTALLAKLDPKPSEDERNKHVVAALSHVPNPIRRAELLADHYLSSGQPEQAVRQLSAASKQRPDDVRLLERLFAAVLQAKDWPTARALRTQAAELNADGAGGRLYEGRLALAMGLELRSDASKERSKDKAAARKDEDDAVAWFGTAVDALRAGVEEASGMPMARVWLGQALYAYGQTHEAKDAYRAALLLNPLNAEAHRELARLGENTPSDDIDVDKHLTAAIQLSTKSLDGLPTDTWLRDQAQAIYERKHPAESIRRREARRKAEPNDSDNVFRLGLLYSYVGQEDKAKQRLAQALAMAPKDIELHERVAQLYLREKRFEEGATLLTDLATRLQGTQRAEALLAKGLLLQATMSARKAAGAGSDELGKLRDRTDEAFETAYKLNATPEICQSAANFCLITQRRDKAVEWLRRALRTRQHKLDERPIRYTLITISLSMHPLPEGIEREIEEYDARFQGYEEVSLFWGKLQVARGKLDAGATQYTRYIDRLLRAKGAPHIKPGQLAEAYYVRGELYMRLATVRPEQGPEYLRRAVDDFTQAKTYSATGPRQPRYVIPLAKALRKIGKTEAALRELRAAAREHANNSTVVSALVGMLGYSKAHRGEQEALIRQQVQLRPKEWIWPYLLGQTLENRRADHKAEQAYRKAAELSDYGARGGDDAVVALVKLMAKRAAFRDITELIERHTKPAQRGYVLLVYYGAALAKTDRLTEALAAWSTACNAVIKAQQQIAISEAMMGVLGKERALQAIRDMVKKEPKNVHAVMLLAVTLDRAEQHDKAIELLDRSQPLATQPADKAEVLTYSGTLRMLRDRAKEAVDLFKQALDIDEDNGVALNNLAYALADDLNQPKEALAYARRAAELRPDAVGVLDTLGWCLTQAGEHQTAVGLLSEAYHRRPTLLITYHLAEAYRRQKNLEAARETAEQGLALAKKTKNKKYQAKLQKLLDQIEAGT